jgi:excisionase family DNA binding protein
VNAQPIEPLLTAEDVARLLSVSESLVYQLRRSGKIRAIRVGTLLRFRPADVRAYVNGE